MAIDHYKIISWTYNWIARRDQHAASSQTWRPLITPIVVGDQHDPRVVFTTPDGDPRKIGVYRSGED